MPYRSDGTHVEDVKDPDEIQPPGGNPLLVVLCVEVLRNHVSFALLDDPRPDLRHSSETKPSAS